VFFLLQETRFGRLRCFPEKIPPNFPQLPQNCLKNFPALAAASKIIRQKTLPGEQVNEKTPQKACIHNIWFVVMAL